MMQQQQKHPPRTPTTGGGGMSSLAAAAAASSRQTVSSVRPSLPVVPTCSFFAKGECRRGNACRFRHELTPSPSESYSLNSNKRSRNTTAANKREDAPMCSFYARGDCRRGEACAFRHEEEEKEPVAAATAARSNNTTSSSTTLKEATKRRSSASTPKSSASSSQQHGPEKRWFYGETGWYYGTCHPQPGEWQEHGTARSSIAAATNKSTTTKKKPIMSSLAAAAAAGKQQEISTTTAKRTASPKTTVNSNALPKRQSSKGSLSNTSSRNGRASPKTVMSKATIGKRPSTSSSSVSNSRGSPTTTIATMSVSPKVRDLSKKAALLSGAETTTKNMTQSECESTISPKEETPSLQRNKVPLQPLAVRTDENRGEEDVQTTNVSPTDSSKSTTNSNASSSETNVELSAPHSNETVSQEKSKDAETRSTGNDKTLLQKEEEDLVVKMRTSNESKTQDSNSTAQTAVSSNGKKDGALTTETASQETSKHAAVAHKENTTFKQDPVMAMRTTTSPETKTKKMGILPSFSKLKIDTSELVTDSKDITISRTSTMTEEEEDVSPLAAATERSPSNNFNLMKETFEGKKVSTPPTTTPRSTKHPAFASKKSTLTPPAASTGPSSLARAAAASKQTHTPTAKKSSDNLSDSKDLGISRTSTEEENVSTERSPSNNFNFIKGTFEGKKVSAAKPPPLHSTTTTPRSTKHPALAPKKSTLTPPDASTGPSSLARAAAAAGKQTHTPTAKKSSSNNHNTVPYWERLYQDGVKHNKERMILQSESFDKECTFTPDLRLSTPRSSMDGSSRHRRKSRNDANGSIGKKSQRGRSRQSGSAAVPRVVGGPGTTEAKGKCGGREIDEKSVLSENSHRHDNGRRQTFGSTRWRPGSPSLSTENSSGGGRHSLPNQKPQKSKGSPSSLAARAAAGKNSVSKGKSPTATGGRPFPNNRGSTADNAAFRAPRGPSPKNTGSVIVEKHKRAGTSAASTRPKLVSPSDLNAKEPIGGIYGKRSVKSLAARFEGASGKDSSPNVVPSWGKGGAASSGTPRGNDGKGESHGDGKGIKKVWTKEKLSPLRHRWGSDSDSD